MLTIKEFETLDKKEQLREITNIIPVRDNNRWAKENNIDNRIFKNWTAIYQLDTESLYEIYTAVVQKIEEVEAKKQQARKVEKKTETKKVTKKQAGPNYIQAKFAGRDAESGETINVGDLITYVEGLGWVRADNY